MEEKIALIGSGNAFFKDEGIGLYAGKYLKENYDFNPPISIIDGGTLGFLLMTLLQEYEEVIIVNTGSEEGRSAGEIVIKNTDEFIDGTLVKKTANEVEIAEMLQICSLTEKMAETTVISIIPEDIIAVEVGLTPVLKKAWPDYIETIVELLRSKGVSVTQREKFMGIEEILDIFANPSIEYGRGF